MKGEEATRWFAVVDHVGMVSIAALSPLLGTIADFNGQKKRMLGGFLALGVASVAGMFFIYHGRLDPGFGPVHPGQHRGQWQLRLLRRTSAAHRPR